ncbi:hypothetical protein [Nocardioides sp. 503]|uniref:hypothetical protein n=1 Tax=Nocardioides sp. 503 TaxID=2508326 RepID=UPI0010705931|nr:hypothetical protein [Nocardioides sp. 503]
MLLLALVTAVLVAVPASPASADTEKSKYFKEGYSTSGTIRLHSPSICIKWTVNGVKDYLAVYNHRDPASTSDTYTYLVSMKLRYNSLRLAGFKPDGASCPNKVRKAWSQISIEAHTRGYKCSFNPSVSSFIGFPASFDLGLEIWPSCDTKAKTFLKFSSETKRRAALLRNDDAVLSYVGQERTFLKPNKKIAWKCYGVNFGFQITVGNTTNSAKSRSSRVRICPNWRGSVAGW